MKRVLMYGDAGCRTGFARVVKGVADQLHASGDWEVVVRGTNYLDDHGIDYAYDAQSATYGGPDPTGADVLAYHIDDLKPDVLWAVQDPWHLAGYSTEKPRDLPSVCYIPVDAPCLKFEYGLDTGCWSQASTYTRFAATELAAAVQDAVDLVIETQRGRVPFDRQAGWASVAVRGAQRHFRFDCLARLQNVDGWNVLPHGADTTTFFPEDKTTSRREFGFAESDFIVGYVGGNWSRKRLDLAMRAFGVFAKDRPNARLAIHAYNGDQDGYDIIHLARFYGIVDKLYIVHWTRTVLSDAEMRVLYSCFDVLLNTSGGEGWAIPLMEAAACGVPIIAPDWAATGEIWEGHGLLSRVTDWRHETPLIDVAHASVDPAHVAEQLASLTDPHVARLQSVKALARATSAYTWAQVGAGFAQLLDKAIANPQPSPITLDQVLAARTERVYSAVHPTNWPRAA